MITTTSEAPQSTATAEQSCSTPTAGSLAPAAGTSHEGLELDGRAVPGGRPGTTETRDSGHAGDASGSVRRRAVAGSNPARPSPSHDPGHAASVCVADTTSAPGAASPSGLAPAPGSAHPLFPERTWALRALRSCVEEGERLERNEDPWTHPLDLLLVSLGMDAGHYDSDPAWRAAARDLEARMRALEQRAQTRSARGRAA